MLKTFKTLSWLEIHKSCIDNKVTYLVILGRCLPMIRLESLRIRKSQVPVVVLTTGWHSWPSPIRRFPSFLLGGFYRQFWSGVHYLHFYLTWDQVPAIHNSIWEEMPAWILAGCLRTQVQGVSCRGVRRIWPGGMHILANLPPPPDLDPDPHQDFEQDPDPSSDPHQNNADPQPWAQLSKDCCLIYNYV